MGTFWTPIFRFSFEFPSRLKAIFGCNTRNGKQTFEIIQIQNYSKIFEIILKYSKIFETIWNYSNLKLFEFENIRIWKYSIFFKFFFEVFKFPRELPRGWDGISEGETESPRMRRNLRGWDGIPRGWDGILRRISLNNTHIIRENLTLANH